MEKRQTVAASTVIALLDNVEHTERVVHALRQAGFTDRDLSVVMRDWSEQRESEKPGESGEPEEPGEARSTLIAKDTAAGAVAGSLPGLLGTLVGLVVPGLGALRVVGPLMAALGAAEGALFGAAIGEIAASEIPEEQSRIYEERLKQGHVLLAVHSNQEAAPRAERILAEHGAQEVFRTV